MTTLEFLVSDMACSACADSITQAVQAVDPQATVMADPQTKQVTITTASPSVSIREAIAQAGYTIT